jgi:CRISPR/Cas system-associated exonuclease Cas4 (RecB family)
LGRIDRIDEIAEGKWRVVDYKSGRETVSEDEIRNDPAMGIYQLILKRKFPENQISAQIVALKSNDRAEVSLSESELAQLESDILSIGGQILASDWDDVVPKWKPLCEGCDFRPLCSHNPDYVDSIPVSVSDPDELSAGN